MARGGFRPGAGRKKGTKDKTPREPKKKTLPTPEAEERQKLREMLKFDKKAKARFYNEYLARVSKGEPLSIAEKKHMDQLAAELSAELNETERIEAAAENLTPLDYMLKVMNDPQAEKERRDRMAQAEKYRQDTENELSALREEVKTIRTANTALSKENSKLRTWVEHLCEQLRSAKIEPVSE